MMFKGWFPNDIRLVRRFYDNQKLACGYREKLDGMKGEFVFLICKDKVFSDIIKLRKLKSKLRSVRNIDVDFNLVHGSESLSEFIRQLDIMEMLPWKYAG